MSSTELVADVAASQQPIWANPEEVAPVLAELRARHPLVDSAACHCLLEELGTVARGQAFVIQGGDCAELFADSGFDRVERKAAQLEDLADLFESITHVPVVRIGRFAGQYAKPRSTQIETLPDGTELPAYRGDAVNDLAPTVAGRQPDVRRLLAAYDHAAAALDALFVNRFLPSSRVGGQFDQFAHTYVSHEALLLDFERSLVRPDSHSGTQYGSSAHFLWIGDRTRQPNGAHVAFAESVSNPVGVKVGPTTSEEEIASITARLALDRPPGRLTLITRLGAGLIAERLPTLLAALGDHAHRLVWLCDPMHGNTRRTAYGQKTRLLADVLDEVRAFFSILRQHDVHPGGLHLEITPDSVGECASDSAALHSTEPLPRYLSACDPRLNPDQARQVVALAAELLQDECTGERGGRD